jgi:hypothetical protein
MSDAEDYIRFFVESARAEEARVELVAAIEEGLATPLIEVTPAHWQELRDRVTQAN